MLPNPEFDKAGYCGLCHVPVAEFDGNQNIVKLLGSYRLADFNLSDGSILKVALCETCKENMTPEQIPTLMESVYKGWVFEIDHYLKWDTARQDKYLADYGDKFIVGREDKKWNRETVEQAVGKKNMKGVFPKKPLSAEVMDDGAQTDPGASE